MNDESLVAFLRSRGGSGGSGNGGGDSAPTEAKAPSGTTKKKPKARPVTVRARRKKPPATHAAEARWLLTLLLNVTDIVDVSMNMHSVLDATFQLNNMGEVQQVLHIVQCCLQGQDKDKVRRDHGYHELKDDDEDYKVVIDEVLSSVHRPPARKRDRGSAVWSMRITIAVQLGEDEPWSQSWEAHPESLDDAIDKESVCQQFQAISKQIETSFTVPNKKK